MRKKPQNEVPLEKARHWCQVWGERGRWEKQSYREQGGQRGAKEEQHTQGEERNRKKRWEGKTTQQDDLPDKS